MAFQPRPRTLENAGCKPPSLAISGLASGILRLQRIKYYGRWYKNASIRCLHVFPGNDYLRIARGAFLSCPGSPEKLPRISQGYTGVLCTYASVSCLVLSSSLWILLHYARKTAVDVASFEQVDPDYYVNPLQSRFHLILYNHFMPSGHPHHFPNLLPLLRPAIAGGAIPTVG